MAVLRRFLEKHIKEMRVSQSFLTWGPQAPGSPWIEFNGSVNLDVEKITTLFSLTPNGNLALVQ